MQYLNIIKNVVLSNIFRSEEQKLQTRKFLGAIIKAVENCMKKSIKNVWTRLYVSSVAISLRIL